jgi:hypothetical protein
LAGAKDELVPHQQMKQLFAIAQQHQSISSTLPTKGTATDVIRIHVIPNGTHNESWLQGGSEYWEAIRSFITTALQQQPHLSNTQKSFIHTNTVSDPNLDETDQTAIPIMPNQFVNIAKSAISSSSSGGGSGGVKKEL